MRQALLTMFLLGFLLLALRLLLLLLRLPLRAHCCRLRSARRSWAGRSISMITLQRPSLPSEVRQWSARHSPWGGQRLQCSQGSKCWPCEGHPCTRLRHLYYRGRGGFRTVVAVCRIDAAALSRGRLVSALLFVLTHDVFKPLYRCAGVCEVHRGVIHRVALLALELLFMLAQGVLEPSIVILFLELSFSAALVFLLCLVNLSTLPASCLVVRRVAELLGGVVSSVCYVSLMVWSFGLW